MIHDMIGNMGWEMGAAVRIGRSNAEGAFVGLLAVVCSPS